MIRSMVSKMVRSMITTVINPFDGLISRYFVTLDPVLNSYYEMAQPITFAGDFEIEVEFSTSNTGTTMILGNLSSSVSYLATVGAGNQLRLNVNGAIIETPILAINDGKLHKVKVTRASGVVEIYIDNFLRASGTTTDSLSFDVVGRFQDGLYFNGIIANAKFTDKSGASDVVTTFKLDNSPAAENYIYGSEEVVNGDFATDLSGWVNNNNFWNWSNGKAFMPLTSSANILNQECLVIGAKVRLTFDIEIVSGSFIIRQGPDSSFATGATTIAIVTSSGSYSYYFTVDESFLGFWRAESNTSGSIDNVSVKEIIEVAS